VAAGLVLIRSALCIDSVVTERDDGSMRIARRAGTSPASIGLRVAVDILTDRHIEATTVLSSPTPTSSIEMNGIGDACDGTLAWRR
jgi:hypothetical protein